MATIQEIEQLLTKSGLQLSPEAKSAALANPDVAFLQLQSAQIQSGGYRRVGESGTDVNALKAAGLYKGAGIYKGDEKFAELTPANQVVEDEAARRVISEQKRQAQGITLAPPPIPQPAPQPEKPAFFQTPSQRAAAYTGAGLPVPNLDEIKTYDKTANDAQSSDADKLESAGFKVEVRKSSDLAAKLVETLEGGTKPVVPDLISKFNEQRASLGVGKLETDLAKMEGDLAKLDADYLSTLQEEELRPVSMTQIRRRQGADDVAYQRARRDLVAQKDSVARQLDVKYGTINTIMNLTGKQYDIARSDYEFQFNKNISLINLIKGIEDSDKADAERRQDNARANVQIMANLLKDGNVEYKSLDSTTQLDIKRAELEAGLPSGFTSFVAKASKGREILFHTTTPDGKGEMVMYKDGTSQIVSFGAHGGDVKKETEEIENFQKDVASWIEKLDKPAYSAEKTNWRTAWDALHAKYPKASVETIDNALGLQRRNE